jgi:hypothetical protein
MYRISLGIPRDLFRSARNLRPRVVRRLNTKLTTKVQPQLQQDVRHLVIEPRPVVHPFEFSTPKSRRWYFANKAPRGSRGGSYARTHKLIQAWKVAIIRVSERQYVIVTNEIPESQYVYGLPFLAQFHTLQRQVPGHWRTGWGNEELRIAIALINEHAVELIRQAYRETIQEELRA